MIAAVRGDAEGLVSESADLLYHWLVVLAIAGVPLSAVLAELQRRTGAVRNSPKRHRAGATRSGKVAASDGPARSDRPILALSVLHGRALGGVPRRYAADADRRRGARLGSLNDPIDLDEVRRIYLSMSRLLSAHVESSQLLFRQRQAFFNAPDVIKDAVHHRHGRLGGGRQVDHRAHPQGAAGALAVEPQGRPRHHRRFPLSERRAAPRKPDGAQGFSRQLRRRRAAALPFGHQVGPARRARAGLFAPDL